jgi:hypothetical protein
MIALLALLCGLPEVLWLGGWNPAGSAATTGMGGGLFMDRSALGALENPAYAAVSGKRADLSGGVFYTRESRSRMVYDSFGGVVGESEQAFNQGTGFTPGGVAGSYGGENWGLAAGVRAIGSFGYDYSRIERDEAYVQTSEESLESSGLLWELGGSAGYSPLPGWCVGAGAGFVTGSRTVRWSVLHVDPSVPDESWEQEDELTGAVIRASGSGVMGRLRFAAGVSMPVGWSTTDGNGTDSGIEDALEVTCGLGYLPGNRLRSSFSAEANWRDEGEPGLRNTWGIRGGVENHLPGGPIARFGFDYRTSPVHRALDTVSFTTGIGFSLDGWCLDAGLRLTPSRWRQSQVPGLPGFSQGDSLSMESLTSTIVIGISRDFGEVPLWR